MAMNVTASAARPPADRFMRRLLQVEGDADKTAIFGARRSTSAALIVSGVRCTLTYLLIPILVPFVGLLSVLAAPISIVLCVVAAASAVSGVRRFWLADHRSRWAYTAFIGVVLAALGVAIGFDLAALT